MKQNGYIDKKKTFFNNSITKYNIKKVKEAFSFLVLHAQGNEFLSISSTDGLRVEDIPPLPIRNHSNEKNVCVIFL